MLKRRGKFLAFLLFWSQICDIATGIVLAAAGIVSMWIAGFKGNLDIAAFSFFFGGIAACGSVLCIG